jgi:hypothetical protein
MTAPRLCAHLEIVARSLQRLEVSVDCDSDWIWCEEHQCGATTEDLAKKRGDNL